MLYEVITGYFCQYTFMRKPSLALVHPEASRDGLLKAVREIPGALSGIKIAALLLTLEGQRPGWIAEVLGMTLV